MIKRKNIALLSDITDVLLSEELDYLELSKAIKDYKRLLTELSGLNLDDERNRKDIVLDNGIAIGTLWAAMCLDDIIRTKRFVKGLYHAINTVLENKNKPVEILYAGSGPFATLILPLTTRFSAEEMRVRIIEINPKSCAYLKRLIGKLNLEQYIDAIEMVDATEYVVDSNQNIDILLSETMQQGLKAEHQVPIVLNLLNQLKEDVILIPEKVELSLGLIKCSTIDPIQLTCKKLVSIFELNKQIIQQFKSESQHTDSINFPKKTVELTRDQINQDGQLALLTDIQTYGREQIYFNESSLSLPIIIEHLKEDLTNDLLSMSVGYELGKNPGMKFEVM